MNNFIIAKAIFIIIAGLVGSYFIIKSDDGIKLSDEKSKKENIFNKFSNLIEENPIQWMKDNFQIENFGDKIQNAGQVSENKNQTVNLTEFVAQLMFSQMKDLDQKGVDPLSSFNPQSQEGQELIKQTIAKISDPSLLIKDYLINDKDLKISQDNSSVKKRLILKQPAK